MTSSCKNDVFDLLCFISLAKLEEIIADNLANFKSRSTWIHQRMPATKEVVKFF